MKDCFHACSSNVCKHCYVADEIIGKMSEVLASHFADYVGLLTANMPRDVSVACWEMVVYCAEMLFTIAVLLISVGLRWRSG